MTCRVAIVGLGMVAGLHVQAVNSLYGFEVYGVFSRDHLRTKDFAKSFTANAIAFRNFVAYFIIFLKQKVFDI